MGLENRAGGTYITILGGKFCQRVEKGTEGAVSRINKMGKEVYELFYDSFTGILYDIKVKDSEYGKTWNFIFEDSGQFFTIQLPYSGSFSTAFLKMLPNIDLKKPFKLSPSQKMVDGKNQSSLFINQDDKHIKHAYTKDNPNGLPMMKKVMVKGQEVWDDTDRINFLFNMVNTDIKPKLGKDVLVEGPTTADPKMPTQAEVNAALKEGKDEIKAEEIDF